MQVLLRPHRRWSLVLVVLAALAAIATTGATAATASDSTPTPPARPAPVHGWGSAQQLMAAQAPLVAAADAITKAAGPDTGLGGIQLAVADHEVRVAWKGAMPAAVRAKLDTLRSPKVHIEVRPAAYTRAELIRHARRVVSDHARYPDVISAAPLPDGSGLEVGVATAGRRPRFAVPARVHAQQRLDPYSRRNDAPPWKGSAAIFNPATGDCSAGFGVYRDVWSPPWTWTRVRFVPTADHCGDVGTTFTDPTGETVGTVTERNQPNFWGVRLGVSLIRAESTNDTYAGGINDGTESLKYQAGALGNYVGMWVCTSGGASGGHCGIKVTRTGVAVDGLSDLVVAEQPDKMVAAGGGDSGGPVYVPVDNSALIRALGLIQGGGLQSTHFASCPPTGFASRCSWQVWYTDINAILYWMGLQLAGGS